MLDQALMEILACPKCKAKVEYNNAKDALVYLVCRPNTSFGMTYR